MDNKFYIYFHINPLTNKVFYVGMGSNNRAYIKTGRNKHWKNTVNKYGYIVDIVITGLSREEALNKEMFYIKRIGRDNLVNMTDGGIGGISNKNSLGKKRTIEVRDKISKSKMGKDPWNKGLTGVQVSHRKGVYKEYDNNRTCSKCSVEKSIDEFYSFRYNDVLRKRTTCKKCDNTLRVINKNKNK